MGCSQRVSRSKGVPAVGGGPTRHEGLQPVDYRGSTFALLTQHGKQAVIAPVLSAELAVDVDVVTGFDTDTLGTFTREVPRLGTQREAASAKAHLAVQLSDCDFGLGSEGVFVPGPLGFGAWNLEEIVFFDSLRDLHIVGIARGVGQHLHTRVTDVAKLVEFAQRAGFPEYGLVLRPDGPDEPHVFKGAVTFDELVEQFHQVVRRSADATVFVESDLRAHRNPTRMAIIRAAAEDLVGRLQSHCPRCQSPGFGVAGVVRGLECALCGTPTQQPRALRWACVSCDYEHSVATTGPPAQADPSRCDVCNP